MSRTILIDPVSRIEGHAKISLFLDDAGEVSDARFHVTEFRGFEKFCEGRPLAEMAGITARICGICPVSHLIASAKTGDAILAVTIPPAAAKLRRLMNLGQIVQSHALSFFHLSAPDLLLGFDSNPATRNVFGLMAQHPDIARKGIRLRQFGQEIIESLGGKKIHPAWAVPGGVREGLSPEKRDYFRGRIDEMGEIALGALLLFKQYVQAHRDEVNTFGDFPTLFMGLVGTGNDDGLWEHYDGQVRIVDSNGKIVERALDPQRYSEFLGEAVVPWSYLKMPYYKPMGYPGGAYRVGPLARLNVCVRMGTPLADTELREFRKQFGGSTGVVTSSFQYHYARLIEILAAIERINHLLDDDDLSSDHLRAHAGINRREGVGVSEAPRGTLFHHYRVDKHGLITRVNFIIATGQNNYAMNEAVKRIAQHYIHGASDGQIDEGLLNRVEAGVRAYDPCLSCSTHAIGQMPLAVEVMNARGELVKVLMRG
jgi:NAD-reducing hydrogenase large subunit